MTKQQVLDIAGNSINYLGTMASLIYTPANSGNTGVGGAAVSALQGAAAGASLGSVIPGIGTAAGAIVGGVGGFLTSAFKKGKVTTNGFYEDPTMQKGGIFTNNRKLRRRYNWAKDVVQANRAGLVSSELAEYNWLQDHDADVFAAANGGVTGSLVYGNDGELVKLPNGEMQQFAELGLPTDSQLALLPTGSKILNKKDSEKITEKMKSSKYKDKYALGTDAANKLIASIQFDLAFEKLEIEKAKKGIKPKTKLLVPAAKDGLNFGPILSKVSSLAPIMSNLLVSQPEPVTANYNPYESSILNTMRKRKYNAQPLLDDVNRNRAISNYNIRNMNTNTGSNLAYSLQNTINTNRAIRNIRNQELNINAQYLADYANITNNLGQQRVGATNLAADLNAQNRATTENIRGAGLSQLSKWFQNDELMRNSRVRDNAMLALYAPFLKAGNTAETIKQFYKWLREGGNNVDESV